MIRVKTITVSFHPETPLQHKLAEFQDRKIISIIPKTYAECTNSLCLTEVFVAYEDEYVCEDEY